MPNITNLVAETIAGSHEAFTELVRTHERMVFALAYQRTGDPTEAEDIAQESFLRSYQDLSRLRKPALFGKWLYGITLNVMRERARHRELAVPLESVPEPVADGGDLDEQKRTEQVLALVAQLPDKYRLPLTLHYVEGMKHSQIAEALDVPETTVRSLVHRAKEKIAKTLGL